MKFGLFFLAEQAPGFAEGTVFANTLEQCKVADDLGYDVLWLTEHHFAPYGLIADSMLMGAALSQSTRRISIGQAIVVTPFHHPIRLAEQVAMLDLLSNGRLNFGIGRGYQTREFDGFGIDQDEATARFQESMAIIEGLLTNESFSYEGQFWTLKDVVLTPKTHNRMMPPTFVAVNTTASSFDWAIQKGYDILGGNPYGNDPRTSASRQAYLDALTRNGRNADSLSNFWGMTSHVFAHEDSEKAKDIYRPGWTIGNSLFATYGAIVSRDKAVPKGFEQHAQRFTKNAPVDYDEVLAAGSSLVGSPDEIVEKIHLGFEKLPMENYILWMGRGGCIDQRDLIRSMELFADKVIPQVRHLTIKASEGRGP